MRVLSFRLALRFLRGNARRFVSAALAIGIGVALVCAIEITTTGVLATFGETIDAMAGRASLQVRAGEDGVFPEEIASVVAATPGVALAVPVVSALAFPTDGSRESLSVHAIPVTDEAAIAVYEPNGGRGLLLDDPLVFISQPDSVAITRVLAARRGLALGDALTLDTATGRRRFTVRALLDPEGIGRAYGGNLVLMDLYAAEAAFTRPGLVNRVDIVPAPGTDLAGLSAALAARLPSGLQVETPAQRRLNLADVTRSLQQVLRAVALLGLLAAMLIAFTRVTTVFESQVWQLGVMQATGVPQVAVWWESMKQCLLVGAAGAAIGVPLGIAVGWIVAPLIGTATALAYNLARPPTGLAIEPSTVALAVAGGLSATFVAGALPAWRAAQHGIVGTLRTRGMQQARVRRLPRWLPVLLGTAGSVLAVILQTRTQSAPWGLAATGLIAATVALAARPLVEGVGPRLVAVVGGLVGPAGRFVGASLLENAARTSLIVAVLGVSVGTVLYVWIVGRSFERSVSDALGGIIRSELIVTSAHVASGYNEAPMDERILAELRAVPGVLAVAGERVVDWPYRGGPIAFETVDPLYFGDSRFGEWPLYGGPIPDLWRKMAAGEAVLVSNNFVKNLGVAVGDVLTLDTPNGPLARPIGAATAIFTSPRGTVIMSRELYRRFWNDPRVTRAFVRTRDGADPGAVAAAIGERLAGRHDVRILRSAELVQYFADQVANAFASVYALAAMVLTVVLLGLGDTLAGTVADRRRELATMRAVGVEDRHLFRLVIAEAIVIAVLGIVLALAMGISLGLLWVRETFPLVLGWVVQLDVPYGPAAVVAALTLAVCLLASILPARAAVATDPALALRYE